MKTTDLTACFFHLIQQDLIRFAGGIKGKLNPIVEHTISGSQQRGKPSDGENVRAEGIKAGQQMTRKSREKS